MHVCVYYVRIYVRPISWEVGMLRDICNDNVARISQWGLHECQKGAMWLWTMCCVGRKYTQIVRAISRFEADGKWK